MSGPRDPNSPGGQKGGRFGRPVPRQGAARHDATSWTEHVTTIKSDPERDRRMAKTEGRLVTAAGGFIALFCAVLVKLAFATIVAPLMPHRVETPIAQLVASVPHDSVEATLPGQRAMITDRNGQPMAISLSTVALYADPRQVGDAADTVHQLQKVLPDLNFDETVARLKEPKKFVYLARELTPRQELAINDLGLPGIDFQPTEHRSYPLGRTAAQVLGGVDVDEHGFAGVERFYDERLRTNTAPLRLSIDLQVQAAVREELLAAMEEFEAIGACGIVMDVHTGEVLAMVSLPDYDANDVRNAAPDARFNRAVEGTYEPGSTFKLQTASMALDSGEVHIWDEFDASRPIRIGRFTITDFQGKHRWLYLPEVLAYSSNLGAAHIAVTIGGDRQRAWLKNMGMFGRTGIELPESASPIVQPAANWKEVVTMTVGFGHGISVTPLHVVRGTAAVATGILYRPTIMARNEDDPAEGRRVMSQSTNDIMRKLMRLVVTDGFGKAAEVAGYYPGGKTGTAEKVGAHGAYRKHTNVSAFTSVFPMNDPRYAVYMMLDEPHGNKSTYGYSTAGWVAAPAAGRVISRIGPMLGLLPDIADKAEIDKSLFIPLQPGRPPGAPARGPGMTPVAETAPKPKGKTIPSMGTTPVAHTRPTQSEPATTPVGYVRSRVAAAAPPAGQVAAVVGR